MYPSECHATTNFLEADFWPAWLSWLNFRIARDSGSIAGR
jgi:hypothetical protein